MAERSETNPTSGASDRGLDVALAGLSRAVSQRVPDEDDAFTRAVIQRVGEAESVDPIDPADLDELLDAPLPDDFDAASRAPSANVGPSSRARDDRATSGPAATAAATASREPRMSTKNDPPPSLRDPMSGRPSQLEGLARLSMSGPPNSSRAPDDGRFGEDSGLINLKALNDPEEELKKELPFAAAAAPASAPVSAPSLGGPASKRGGADAAPVSKKAAAAGVAPPVPASGDSRTSPEAPVARASRAPIVAGASVAVAATAAAAIAAAPTAATAPGAASASPANAPKKKGGMLVIGLFGGIVTMAAAAIFYVSTAHKSDTAATSAVMAKAEAPKASASSSAAASVETVAVAAAAPSASAPALDETVAMRDGKDMPEKKPEGEVQQVAPGTGGAGTPKYGEDQDSAKTASKSKKAAMESASGDRVAAADVAAAAPPPPTPTTPPAAAAAASATEGRAVAKTGGLDDMLGLGAGGAPPAKPTAAVPSGPDLPDRPDSTDIRSAINKQLGRASGCVKGLDGPSKVTVSFAPDGSVTGVSVTSGPAKGTGAEACISTAFRAAKVPSTKKGATGFATVTP